MEKIQLRQYRPSDQDIVWKLHVEGLKQTGSFLNDMSYNQDLLHIKETYLDNKGEFFMATLDDQVVGIGALKRIDDTTAEIKRMRVDIKHQRQGIGSMILEKLIEKAHELGYKKIILDTSENQKAAIMLYEKRGFKVYKRGKVASLNTIYYELNLE